MTDKSLKHLGTFLGIMFLMGTSCTDNSDLKTQLAVAQTQMTDQATINQLQMQNAAAATKAKCIAGAGTDTIAIQTCNNL